MLNLFLSKVIETKVGDYIYDALNNKIISLPKNISIEIKKNIFSGNYFKFIKENNLRDFREYVNFKINCNNFYSDEELNDLLNTSMNSITLCTTENCNLRCEYCCYVRKYQDNNYKLKNMSKATAFKAIDFLMKNSSSTNRIYLGFYGGESFLNFDLIKSFVNYCEKNILLKFLITTLLQMGCY